MEQDKKIAYTLFHKIASITLKVHKYNYISHSIYHYKKNNRIRILFGRAYDQYCSLLIFS